MAAEGPAEPRAAGGRAGGRKAAGAASQALTLILGALGGRVGFLGSLCLPPKRMLSVMPEQRSASSLGVPWLRIRTYIAEGQRAIPDPTDCKTNK